MDFEQLTFKLREFYLLEVFQVQLYNAQVKSFPDEYNAVAFEKMAKIEQGHVNYYAGKMQEYGISKPEIADDVFSFAGFVTAKTLDLLSFKERYQLAVTLETKAIKMYHDFIEMTEADHELRKMLWEYLIDEEFHKFWCKANLSKIDLKEQLLNV
ncbi:MAG TPA: ferritin-like domain-containing protein [Bacillota bacterium]|nr:ferritin-like domain-containing protein [Bacillota bacterium]